MIRKLVLENEATGNSQCLKKCQVSIPVTYCMYQSLISQLYQDGITEASNICNHSHHLILKNCPKLA